MAAGGVAWQFATADVALRREAAEFTIALVKAMLQTSYYSPEHPAAKGVAMEPFQRLKNLEDRFREVSFMLTDAADDGSGQVALEGIFPEPMPVAQLIKTTAGNVFPEKLRAYFHRNSIVGVAIRAAISEEEFDRFIQVFVERNVALLSGGAGADVDLPSLTEHLHNRGVNLVTVIELGDIADERRRLPWRIRVAIGRLRKDLRSIPLYANASREQLQAAKATLIEDVIRPLRRPERLRDLLVNSDLIVTDVAELRNTDIEDEIVSVIRNQMLAPVTWVLVKDLGKLPPQPGDEHERRESEAVKRNVRKLAIRLVRDDYEQAQVVMRHLFEQRLFSFQELPPRLQQRIHVEGWRDQFMRQADATLKQFATCTDTKEYLKRVSVLTAIFRDLVEQEHLEEARRIVQILDGHSLDTEGPNAERAKVARKALDRLATEPTIKALVARLAEDHRDIRRNAAEMLAPLGKAVVPYVLDLLGVSPDQKVRKVCCMLVSAVGPDATPALRAALEKRDGRWFFLRNLVMLLGDLKDRESLPLLVRYTNHPNPRIREEALFSLYKIDTETAEPRFVAALRDSDASVRRRALGLLNAIDSTDPGVAAFVVEALRVRDEDETPADTSLQALALEAIRRIGNLPVQGYDSMEKLLLEALAATPQSGLRKLVSRRYQAIADEVRADVATTLGHIGTMGSNEGLQRALKDASEAVRDAAAKALRQIAKRFSGKALLR